MVGGDYAAIADNLTREIMVMAIESPKDRETLKEIYAAGKCASEVAAESGLMDQGAEENEKKEEQEMEEQTPEGDNAADWQQFAADTDSPEA